MLRIFNGDLEVPKQVAAQISPTCAAKALFKSERSIQKKN
jgi:hypothetical protein